MSDKTWYACCVIAALFVLSIPGCVAYQNMVDNEAITKMVQNGADPTKVACAIRPASIGQQVCAVSASK